jgi:hypothetical protein
MHSGACDQGSGTAVSGVAVAGRRHLGGGTRPSADDHRGRVENDFLLAAKCWDSQYLLHDGRVTAPPRLPTEVHARLLRFEFVHRLRVVEAIDLAWVPSEV